MYTNLCKKEFSVLIMILIKILGAVKTLTNGATNILEQYTEIVDLSPEMSDEVCIYKDHSFSNQYFRFCPFYF